MNPCAWVSVDVPVCLYVRRIARVCVLAFCLCDTISKENKLRGKLSEKAYAMATQSKQIKS